MAQATIPSYAVTLRAQVKSASPIAWLAYEGQNIVHIYDPYLGGCTICGKNSANMAHAPARIHEAAPTDVECRGCFTA